MTHLCGGAAFTSFSWRLRERAARSARAARAYDNDLEELTLEGVFDVDEEDSDQPIDGDYEQRGDPAAVRGTGEEYGRGSEAWEEEEDETDGASQRPASGGPRRSQFIKGYFDRRDLPRLKVADLDKTGELQGLSLEELESRVMEKNGLKRSPSESPSQRWTRSKMPPRGRVINGGPALGRPGGLEVRIWPGEEESARGVDTAYWEGQRTPAARTGRAQASVPWGAPEKEKPFESGWGRFPPEKRAFEDKGRRLGADRADGGEDDDGDEGPGDGPTPTPVAAQAAQAAPTKARARQKTIDRWLMPSLKEPEPKKVKKVRLDDEDAEAEERSPREGESRFAKMYRAALRKVGPLPWQHVEGAKSWTDPSDQTWQELGINGSAGNLLVSTMEEYGVIGPNVLQEQSTPVLVKGTDALLTSMTGSGKTLAFLVPLLKAHVLTLSNVLKVKHEARQLFGFKPKVESKPRLLVVAPSRELAAQTHRVITDLLEPFPQLNCTLLLGGANHKRQDESLKFRQPVVVVGTPGRIVDHASEGRLVLSQLRAVVLDEVDSLLNVSRRDHLELLMEKLGPPNASRMQRVLVSATGAATEGTLVFAKDHLHEGFQTIGPASGLELPSRVLHLANGAPDVDKKLLFLKRLQWSNPMPNGVLVFCNNFERARKVAEQLRYMGIPSEVLSGNRSKESREAAVRKMDMGQIDMLVATDVATRGLDFRGLTHVVNFELPTDSIAYAHRAGRCGRHGHNGIVISLGGGGAQNNRLSRYARELNITLFEANVEKGQLGVQEGKAALRMGRMQRKPALQRRS